MWHVRYTELLKTLFQADTSRRPACFEANFVAFFLMVSLEADNQSTCHQIPEDLLTCSQETVLSLD